MGGVTLGWGSNVYKRRTMLKQRLGVASGLSSEDGYKGCRQAGTAPHNVVPRLTLPLHVGQQMVQPLLRQAVQLWGGLQQHPAEQGQTQIKTN